MNLRERILAAARELARARPLDQIGLTDVARAAGVSRPTVRRYLGGRERLRELLAREQADSGQVSPDTRSRLLAAAARVFARQGYAGATLAEVAADAGLTTGAVYWHFTGKSDLFLALLEERTRAQLAGAGELVAMLAGAADPEAGLAALLAAVLGPCRTDSSWPRLFLEFVSQSREPAVRTRLAQFYRTWNEAVQSLLQQLKSEGHIGDVDPHKGAVLFNAIVNGLTVAWLIDPEQVDPVAWAPVFSRILWRGVRPAANK